MRSIREIEDELLRAREAGDNAAADRLWQEAMTRLMGGVRQAGRVR